MDGEFLNIEYLNFNPNREMKELALNVMRGLAYASPSDAAVKLTISELDGGFEAICKIASSTIQVVSKKRKLSFESAMADIEKEVNQKLWIWKSNRFKKSEGVAFRSNNAS